MGETYYTGAHVVEIIEVLLDVIWVLTPHHTLRVVGGKSGTKNVPLLYGF